MPPAIRVCQPLPTRLGYLPTHRNHIRVCEPLPTHRRVCQHRSTRLRVLACAVIRGEYAPDIVASQPHELIEHGLEEALHCLVAAYTGITIGILHRPYSQTLPHQYPESVPFRCGTTSSSIHRGCTGSSIPTWA
eukprot:2416066-Rhodomonas_salina.14